MLYDLPVLEYLLRGEAPLPWMFDQGEIERIATAEPAMRRAALAHGPYAAVAGAGDVQALPECWLAHWRHLLPPTTRAQAQRLEGLVELVRAHRAGLASVPMREAVAARAASEMRRALEAKLVSYFRRTLLEPAAVFAHVLLVALEFERVRGALVGRRLYSAENG
ncbi:MAG TPA: hypothetical protein PL143_06885 [Rhodocyclaceae bacterium]|nr:hypothetical protein [Rhodocyclaceae bacterium]